MGVSVLILLVLSNVSAQIAKYWFYSDIGEIIPDQTGNGYDAVNGSSFQDTSDNWIPVPGRGIWTGSQACHVQGPSNDLTTNSYNFSSTSEFCIAWLVKIFDDQVGTIISRRDGSKEYASLQVKDGQYYWTWRWVDAEYYYQDEPGVLLGEWLSIAYTMEYYGADSQLTVNVNEDNIKTTYNANRQYQETTSTYTIIGRKTTSHSGILTGFIHSCYMHSSFSSNIWKNHYDQYPPIYKDDGHNETPNDCNAHDTNRNCQTCSGCTSCFPTSSDCEPCQLAHWAYDSWNVNDNNSVVTCPYPCSDACNTCDLQGVSQWQSWLDPNASITGGPPGACECNTGYYNLQSSPQVQCSGWDPAWNTCFGPYDTTWHDCNTGFFLQPLSNTCLSDSCPVNYYKKSIDRTCSDTWYPVWSSCSEWWWNCTACSDNNATPDSTGVWVCNPGFITDNTACVACASNWEVWSSTTVCSECSSSYYMQPTPNPDFCLQTWPDNYVGVEASKTCEQCGPNCKTCQTVDPGVWLSCLDSQAELCGNDCWCTPGTYSQLPAATLTWVTWSLECALCDGGTYDDCQSCKPSYYMQPPVLTSEQCRSTCPDQYFGFNSTSQCEAWHADCRTWTEATRNQCIDCNQFNSSVSSGSCVCNDGFYAQNLDPLHCWQCGADCRTCDPTDSDYWLSWWDANATVQAGACICNAGRYSQLPATTLTWVTWPSECSLCDGSTPDDCQACAASYYMQPPVATSEQCRNTCPEQYFPDSTTSECTQCHADCKTWTNANQNSCIECNDVNSAQTGGVCECLDRFYVANANPLDCQACGVDCATCNPVDPTEWYTCLDSRSTVQAGNCICNAGTYSQLPAATLTWVTWPTECSLCDGGTHNDCQACAVGYYMQPPVLTSEQCRSTCPEQYFGNGDTNECETWHADCKTWTGSSQNQWITCNEANATQQGGVWQCIDGWYQTSPNPLECQACANEWEICYEALNTDWTECKTGFYKWRPTGTSDTCLGTWDTKEYGEDSTKSCESWHLECAECTGPDIDNCTAWVAADAKVVAGTCVCEDYAYMIQASPLTCIVWVTEWEEWWLQNNDSCMKCAPNYYKQPPSDSSTSCRATCPSPYFGNDTDGLCDLWDDECSSCTGSDRTECTSCTAANSVPDGSPGPWICASGYFMVAATPLTCIECAAEWDTWTSQLNNNDWDTCSTGHYKQLPVLTSRRCRDSCPAQQYGDDSSGECKDCGIDWETCSGPDNNNCLICRNPLAEAVGNVCGCAIGSYKTGDNPLVCEACADECATCDSDTNNDCISWADGHLMQIPVTSSKACRSGWGADELENTADQTWEACYSEWATCSGTGANECITCKANGAVVVSGTWQCHSSLYTFSTSPLQWIQCAVECDWCSTPNNNNDWLNCSDGSYRLPPVESSTSCRAYWPIGFFGNSQTKNWEECDPACTEWDGPLEQDCSSCSVAFSQVVDGICSWLYGYYRYNNNNAFQCIDCADECSECSATTYDDCIACQHGYYKQPPADTSTSCRSTCPSGYYPDTPSLSCLPCYMDWDECVGTEVNEWTRWIDGHAYPVNGTCSWDIGYYATSTGPLVCEPCNSECLTWDGDTHDDCLTCAPGRVKLPPADISKSWRSSWPDGYFKGTTDWESCNIACETCSGGFDSNCQAWANGFYLLATEPNTCKDEWPLGYLEDADNRECLRCHSTWESWFAEGDEGCSFCYSGYFGQPVLTSKCEPDCADGFYANTETRLCDSCNASCETWDGPTNSNCLTCRDDSQEIVEGKCECKSAYYVDSQNPLTCGPWDPAWQTWYGPDSDNWYTWDVINSSPIGGICTWNVPFSSSNAEDQPLEWKGCPKASSFDSGSNSCYLECSESSYIENYEWQPCTEPWIICSNVSHCIQCQDGYFVNGSFSWELCDKTCVTCQNRAVEWVSCTNNLQQQSSGECSCSENQAIDEDFVFWVAKATVGITVNSDNTVVIEFSRDPGLDLTDNDFSISVIGTNGQPIDFSFRVTKDNAQNYKIEVTPNTTDIAAGSTVNFSLTSEFMAAGQIDATSQVLAGSLNEQLAETALEEQQALEESQETASSGSVGIISSAAFVSTLSYNFAALWKIINYLQIITLFLFFNMTTTPELDGFLSSLLKDSRIPNLYDFVLPADYEAVSMPTRFKKSSYTHPLVLDIFGHTMTIWIMVGFALISALILHDSGFSGVRKFSEKVRFIFIWNGFIRIVWQTSIYIFLGWFLNLKFGVSTDTHAIINTLTSIGFLWLLTAFCMLSFRAIRGNSGNLSSESCSRFKELTIEMKPDPLNFSVYYSIIFIFRRAALCATVVFIESPRIQICLTGFTNFAYLVWVVSARPFITPFINIIEILWETTIVITNFTMLFFTYDTVDKELLGYGVVMIWLAGIAGFMIIILRNFVQKMREKWRNRKQKKKIKDDSNPSTFTLGTESVKDTRSHDSDLSRNQSQVIESEDFK